MFALSLTPSAPRGEDDPLMVAVADGMKSLLKQMLEQGPPPDWNCLPPVGIPAAPVVSHSDNVVAHSDKAAVS